MCMIVSIHVDHVLRPTWPIKKQSIVCFEPSDNEKQKWVVQKNEFIMMVTSIPDYSQVPAQWVLRQLTSEIKTQRKRMCTQPLNGMIKKEMHVCGNCHVTRDKLWVNHLTRQEVKRTEWCISRNHFLILLLPQQERSKLMLNIF